jgi:hypothetical protein
MVITLPHGVFLVVSVNEIRGTQTETLNDNALRLGQRYLPPRFSAVGTIVSLGGLFV